MHAHSKYHQRLTIYGSFKYSDLVQKRKTLSDDIELAWLDDWILRFSKAVVAVSGTEVGRPPSSLLELRERPSDFWFVCPKIDFFGRHTFCITSPACLNRRFSFLCCKYYKHGLSCGERMTTRAASVRKILLSGNWCVRLSMHYSNTQLSKMPCSCCQSVCDKRMTLISSFLSFQSWH